MVQDCQSSRAVDKIFSGGLYYEQTKKKRDIQSEYILETNQ